MEGLSYFTSVSSIAVYGGGDGSSFSTEKQALSKGADVVICTPGRMIAHLNMGYVKLSGLQYLVLDEADRMLDMGFIPDIEEICAKLPKSRQTLLFSATMPPPIQKLASKFLNDPKRVEVARPATANVNIEQRLVQVRPDKKKDALRDILRHEEFKNAIVFANRKTTVRELASSLKRSGFAVGQIQGDMDQSDRIAEFDRFKNDEITILVASDVAARGLDVKGVSHVINFDVPWQPDDYVHRIGRTGRAGMKGISITIATREDREAVDRIEKLIGHKIAGGAADEQAEPAKSDKSEKPQTRGKAQKPPKASTPTTPPTREPKPEERSRSPVVEDIKSEWNGPLPSFLSVSAG
jgi:superfamily II DNA/RNA helicase